MLLGCEFNVESTISYNQKKEGEICRFVHEASLESAQIKPVVCIDAKEKMERWLNS